MGFGTGETILQGLDRGVWPHLEELDLADSSLNEEFIPWLSMVLARGGVGSSSLRRLDVFCPGNDALKELCYALRGGACPALEELCVEVKKLDEIELWVVEELVHPQVWCLELDIMIWEMGAF